jgi:prepilin-type N-terminal cleavage/methylation domain
MLRNSSPFRSRAAKGFTLIELMVTLVIGVIIVGVAVAGIKGVFGKSDVSTDIQGIASLQTAAKGLRSKGGYGTSGTNLVPSLIAMGAVPNTLTLSDNNILNAWGGSVAVNSTGPGFTITSAGIPKDACIEEAATLSLGALNTKINSSAAVTGEMTKVAATAACTSDSNTIVWTSQN